MGCDFAIGSRGDYSVFTVVERLDNGKIVIKYIERYRGLNVQAQIFKLLSLQERFNCARMILDQSNLGVTFVESLRGEGLPIEGYLFTREKRNDLLVNLERIFENKQIIIPRKNRRELTDELVKEITSFEATTTERGMETYVSSAAHDDMVMSLGMACLYASQKKDMLVIAGTKKLPALDKSKILKKSSVFDLDTKKGSLTVDEFKKLLKKDI